jgi:hypothetical protein
MFSRTSWNPAPRKDELIDTINDLIAELSCDPTNQLKHAQRISRDDLVLLERVLDAVKDRLAKPEADQEAAS